MDLIKQKGQKVNVVQDVMHKFKYSFQGFVYCYTHETSFIFETIGIVFSIVCGIICNASLLEWILCIGSLLLIMEVEFLNTAVEATVDMFTKEFHPLAKVAKDCGSAATCTATFVAMFINLAIYLPRLIDLIVR